MIPAVFICVCVCIIVCLMLLIIILKSLSEDWLCWYCSLLVFIATIPIPGLYVNCLYYALFLWPGEKKGETFDSFLSKGRRELLKLTLCWQWWVLLCSFLAGERAPFHTCFVSWINNFLGNWQLRRYSWHSSPEEIVQHVQYKQTPAARASSQFAQSPLLLALLSLPIRLLLPAIVPASFGGTIP